MDQEKRIIVTHCVDPHQFYFKYVNDCVNDEYSKFDYTVQCYGNGLHARKLWEYSPKKNEIIIFFDLTLNKWLRGRVTNADDDDITLWCIDNGFIRKSDKEFIHPLTENLKRDFNLVHLGGLSVLPTESKLNFETINVEMQVTKNWDNEMRNNFKMIIDSAKRISFVEVMQLEKHKFGSLQTLLKNGRVVVINEILVQMNKAIPFDGSAEDMSASWLAFVSKKRSKEKIYQSHDDVSTTTTSSKPKITSNISIKSGTEVHLQTKRFSNASSQSETEVLSKAYESMGTSDASIQLDMEVHSTHVVAKKVFNAFSQTGAEMHSKPLQPKRTSNASSQFEVEVHSKPMESKENSNASSQPDTHSEAKKTSDATGESVAKETSINLKTKTTSDASSQSETEVHSKTDSSNGLKLTGTATIRNDDVFKRNIDKTVAISDNFSKNNEADYLSPPDESIDTLENSASIIVSSIRTSDNQSPVPPKIHRYGEEMKTFQCEYECYLKKLPVMKHETLRRPMQSSIDWINQLSNSVADSAAAHNQCCISSITNLGDFSGNISAVE